MSTVVRKPQNKIKPWTVRWTEDRRQHEQSFTTKGEARQFQTDTDHRLRYGGANPKHGKASFGDLCTAWIVANKANERSKRTYESAYRKHIKPVLGCKTVAEVARDRDAVVKLLCVTLMHLSISVRRNVRLIIVGTLDEAVKGDKIVKHNMSGIELAHGATVKYDEFVPASMGQVDTLADKAGVAVYLMLGCGLRAEEALGVHREHFRQGGRVLRVSQQASGDGRVFLPCKKRNSTVQFRDVPVPGWVWVMVKDCPVGPVQPGKGDRMYEPYETVRQRFMRAGKTAGLPASFTMHSLRHQYGSLLLRAGIPITDVAGWLGHRDIRTTFAEYRSELDAAKTDATAVLDALRAA